MTDAHVHVWTDDKVRYPRAAGEKDYSPARFTPEDLFRHSRPAGVTKVVLIQMSFYKFDNSYMLDSMRAHPGVFSGVGLVDVNAAPGAAMRKLAPQGVRGFRITAADGLESAGMAEMWSTGAETGQAMCLLIGPESLPVVDKLCARFPNTNVVIDHLARIGAGGQVKDADVRALCGLARHPRVRVKLSAFYALGRKTAPYRDLAPLIRRVFEDYGPRRLMWASDCPFQVEGGHTYAASLALVREGLPFLGKEDKEWIVGKTADSVFFS
ncbi:MAG TPA: amidohydrolase family protein [Bryobacteraceae bacterium]|nr:amidohydrolase family protein [Bryobacteraceae bacterium]